MPVRIVLWLTVSILGEVSALNRYICSAHHSSCMWPWVQLLQDWYLVSEAWRCAEDVHSCGSGVWPCAGPPALTFVLFFFLNPFMLLWISPKSNLFAVTALGALLTTLLENMPLPLSGQPFILISQHEQICSCFLNMSVLTASTACSSLFLPG